MSAALKLKKPEPAEVEYKNMRFLITYCPTDATMDKFIEELKKHNVKDVVRVCDPSYSISKLSKENIRVVSEVGVKAIKNIQRVCRFCRFSPVHDTLYVSVFQKDLPFDDGSPPTDSVIAEWFNIVRARFTEDPTSCVACHCVAGLGRAPVLVALALIELGMQYEDAVGLIRQKRRGAINAKQLAYLEKYHPKSRLKMKNGHQSCAVM